MKWRDLEGTVARIFDKSEITGFRMQDLILGPGEAMVLMEDGKIGEVLTQTRLKNVGGGLKNWLARKSKSGKDIVYLFVDTRPFDVDAPFQATTKDYITLNGTMTVKMQINVNDSVKLLNFMREYLVPKYKKKGIIRKRKVFNGFDTEGRSLTKDMINETILKEMGAKVISPVIGRHNASEFHGDTRVVKDIQTMAMVELRKTFGMWGLLLQDMYAQYGGTDYDRTQEFVTRKNLEAERVDAVFAATNIKERERQGELYKTQVRKAEEAKDISFEKARVRKVREDKDNLEKQRIQDDQDMGSLEKMIALKEKMKSQKIQEFQDTELKVRELESQKDVEMKKWEAEKAKFSLESFKEAEERERKHQVDMLEKYSQILGNQRGGGGGTPPQKRGRACVKCGKSGDEGWQSCPFCGGDLE